MRRRKSREFALQILFALENQSEGEFSPDPTSVPIAVSSYVTNFGPKNTEEITDLPYLQRLVAGICAELQNIDAEIVRYSEHWKLYRMTKIDRNILRIGVEELKNFLDIPPKVTIDECVELAKRFGTEDSSAFINGILDKARVSMGRTEE
ncbi:MAG: transcription antitermination factor NusB [Bdellovibrionota bacterium]